MLNTTTEEVPADQGSVSDLVAAEGERPSFATIPTGCADFMARAAHDLRSPLGVITEVLPMLQRDLADQLSDEHTAMLKLANRSLFRLHTFVERMRLVADLELSQLALARNPTPLGAAVQQVIDELLTNEPRRGVTVSHAPGNADIVVDADVAKLKHVVSELLNNAMRHAASKVHVSIQQVQGEAHLIIEDDGTGLSAADERALFQRFVQRPSRNGLGIGLSLARDLVQAHDGRLWYEKSTLPGASGSGAGARFVVSLKCM
ncbi:MAG TPA: HAMP domain-containing sensor histidine kinase [Polyangiaceae bacterium]|nr:HAMP domain-containing sensor histidine kinase [Polyangiaceae bacterium]